MAVPAIAIGFALLGIGGAALGQDAQAPPPYHYVVGKTVAPEDLGPLAALAEGNVQVRNATVVTSAGETVADVKFAATQAGPVLVQWGPRVGGPFLKTLPSAQQVADLAPVLARHVPAGTTLLGWWDVSRQIRMLTGLDVAFGEHLGVPLFVPVAWHGDRERIRKIESRFWQASAESESHARFKRFVHALLAEPRQGVAELRALTQGKPAVLVLHVRDIIQLGQLAPDKIGVAFRDVAWTGDVHGMVKSTYRWLEANDYPAYAVMRLNDTNHQARVIALMDEASGNTLAARLLPFFGDGQGEPVPGIKLVYRTGGFSVYALATSNGVETVSQED